VTGSISFVGGKCAPLIDVRDLFHELANSRNAGNREPFDLLRRKSITRLQGIAPEDNVKQPITFYNIDCHVSH